ncbi:MAG: hypothetical protein R3B67_13700 [Phycisphaerales bacterium]
MHLVSRLVGAKQAMQLDGDKPALLTQADFAHVPVDAVRVSAFQTNISATLEGLEQAMMMSGDPTLEEINEELGFDVVNDLLANFGERAIYYQSNTTGGGGLTSAVALIDLRDAGAMGRAHRKLVDRLNELAADEHCSVRVESRDVGGVDIFLNELPRLPWCRSESAAINGGKLVLAVTPTSMEAALVQMSPRVHRSASYRTRDSGRPSCPRCPGGRVEMAECATDTPNGGQGLRHDHNMLTSRHRQRCPLTRAPWIGFARSCPATACSPRMQFSGGISKWRAMTSFRTTSEIARCWCSLAAAWTLADVQGPSPPPVAGVTMPGAGSGTRRRSK